MGRRPILCLWRGQTGLESSILSACVDLVCLASKNNFLFWIFFRIKAYIWDFSWILVETLRKVEGGKGHRSGVASVLETCSFGIINLGHALDDRSMFGRSPEKSPFLRPSLRSWISQTLKWSKWGKMKFLWKPPCWFWLIGNVSQVPPFHVWSCLEPSFAPQDDFVNPSFGWIFVVFTRS